MKIRVLGCSGAIAAGYKTTAFLLDDDVLIDAGTGVGDLPLEALAAIDHILISHSHLDHVLSIALLADAVMRLRQQRGRPPIQVHGLAQTLDALRQHVFNGIIWPDFTRLPSPEAPALQLMPFETGEVLRLPGAQGERCIEVLSALHTVPAVGFAVQLPDGGFGDAAAFWVYTGDTGPNPALWERLRSMQVAHLVIETAFGDDECQLARISRHLCPRMLGEELTHLPGRIQVHITHIKPGEVDAVMTEVAALSTSHELRALQAGYSFELAGHIPGRGGD
ncbi:MBL fold metallo-hydrolase [Roseateles toxinivorans]|uniref:Ribonuclease BN (tRNA processing enzyme) n=1 Tax=Roseateles toxinivorans TaxID=270368 RepID=A0A4R6QR71_9BURK|nr:3',5'-cyclic-nucleotide phosphodiesterase [Roseateles toxinivorans]TDP73072.1 ribonuclease BN (tRNA processing enzyme) [Roseateles toxinivorans]